MIDGIYVRRWHPFTGTTREPVTQERCWKCYEPNPDLAHTVFEYVAAHLGAELERRVMRTLAEHETTHGCTPADGRWNTCPDAEALWDLLPDGMRPVAIA